MKNAMRYASYGEFFDDLRSLSADYSDLPSSSFYSAWARAAMDANPYVQNRRVKRISTMPMDYSKQQIVDMLKTPLENERALRQVGLGLEWTAYPFRKIRMTYQAVNTCKFYHWPAYLTEDEAKSETMRREGVLLDKFNRRLQPDAWAHQIIGQAWQEGKVAYLPRYEIDKSHNAVNWAFLQQIPSDWWKLVGFNSESKYTIMFDMMYFLAVPGADWRQFGDLFQPYLDDFASVLEPMDAPGNGKRYVFASGVNTVKSADGRKFGVNMERFNELRTNAAGKPELYNANGKWCYYVTLPVEKAWVFEIDDTSRAVAPMGSGLFLSFDQISDIEDVALSVLQNPLISIAFGEIPYYSDKVTETSDPTKLSPTGRDYFISDWFKMLAAANASGIAFFPAPFSNLHMETLPEVTGSSEMTTKQYGYAVLKTGMSGLIPINSDPRAGAVEISAKLEERVCVPIYTQFSRMMESIYRQMGLKHDWRFTMFGGFVSDAKDLQDARDGMQRGILSETLKYLALRGLSIWDDLSVSRMIYESGVLDLRIPLITSMSGQAGQGLPPQAPGRPAKDIDQALAEGGEAQESDLDG